MDNQINVEDRATGSQSLDYVRMSNEVFMEQSSVLSAGAWVERDDTGYECA